MSAPIYDSYHHETGEYLGPVTASLDPLETKPAGQTTYMRPLATDLGIEPPIETLTEEPVIPPTEAEIIPAMERAIEPHMDAVVQEQRWNLRGSLRNPNA